MKIFLLFLTLIAATFPAYAMYPVYSDLDPEWRADLEAKRSRIHKLARAHYKQDFKHDATDIALLQRIVDDHLIPNADIVGYQALGVVFGDAIMLDTNADWKQVKDEYGDNPVLKIRGKTAAIGALTILSKRIEDNGTVDVVNLHKNLLKDIQRLETEFGEDPKQAGLTNQTF